MPPTKVRNVGSGYTSFNYRGQAIAFLDSVQDSGQRPIGGRAGAGTEGVIPLGAKHRLENMGPEPLHLIEVQSGAYLGEDDIVRFEDTYGRS